MGLVKAGQELKSVHRVLNGTFWPETLAAGQSYSIQADDQDGTTNRGWLRVTIGSNGDVAINLDRKGCGFRFPGSGGGNHPRVRNAGLVMAEAIRLDCLFPEGVKPVYSKTRSRELRIIHELLDHLPWLSTLEVATYSVQSENVEAGSPEGWLHVTLTEMNDVWLEIDGVTARFRLFSGGGHKLRVVAALYMMAEAIRLDTEGGS